MRFSPFTHKISFDAINQRKLRSLFKMAMIIILKKVVLNVNFG